MTRRALTLVSTLLLLALAGACAPQGGGGSLTTAAETEEFGVAQQSALRTGSYSGATPTIIPGARRVTTDEVAALLRAAPPPVLLDVATGSGHATLPGAVWLPRGGLGSSFDDEVQRGLVATAERLTGGDRGRAIVAFCPNQNCWLSYNAALRLARAGFTNVMWYRGGYQAWAAAGQPTVPSTASGW
jgi:PQQ-dependent catabolism-associated CXXCW motif protein